MCISNEENRGRNRHNVEWFLYAYYISAGQTSLLQVQWNGSVENAECGVRSVENAECGKCGVWKIRSVENVECGKCGVWKTRSVENAECGKCGVWKMRSVENA